MADYSRRKIVNQYKYRLYTEFNLWMVKVSEMLREGVEHSEINNKLVEIRGECCDFLELCLLELTTTFEHSKPIKGNIRPSFSRPLKSYGKPCQICGERRVYNVCHVIPREIGGSKGEDNTIYLCPTHHFLFDHARLSKEEFERVDRSGLSPEAIEYLDAIMAPKHEMRWKYQTNRFKGCTCGSRDFDFRCRRSEYTVEIVLVCKHCNETWMNLWEAMHPIAQLKTIIYDMRMPEADIKETLDTAERSIRAFLDDLDKMLASSRW